MIDLMSLALKTHLVVMIPVLGFKTVTVCCHDTLALINRCCTGILLVPFMFLG